MKLTELRLVGHFGDHPSLFAEKPRGDGSRSYFPHIHIGGDECARPRFYRPSQFEQFGLQQCHRQTITINEAGDYASTHQTFDALTDLWASAPEMLRMLVAVAGSDLGTGRAWAGPSIQALVDRLMAHDVESKGHGWGPYFNADGTPYVEP